MFNESYDFEREFYKECADKKRVGRNIFARAATRAGRTTVCTPLSFMNKKEAHAYIAPSPVVCYRLEDMSCADRLLSGV